MDLTYMKYLRGILTFLDAWPYRVFGEKDRALLIRNNILLFIVWVYTLLAFAAYIKKNTGVISFFELGQHYLAFLMNCVSLIYDRVNRICVIFTIIIFFETWSCIISFNVQPIYNNYKAGLFSKERPQNATFEHSLYYKQPLNCDTNIYAYVIITIVNFLMVHDCGSCFGYFDLFMFLMMMHLWGHLKTLDHNLRNFPRPSGEGENSIYSSEENDEISKLLKENIIHYRMIKQFIGKLMETFGIMLCLFIAYHQVSGCLFLLVCSNLQSSSLIRYGGLTIAMSQQLVQSSIVVECLGSQIETVPEAVYSLPWELMTVKHQRTVLMFLLYVQREEGIKALGVVPLGVRTMAGVLKTSFSYFMLLRTFAAGE